MPGYGRLAYCRAAERNAFSLWQSDESAGWPATPPTTRERAGRARGARPATASASRRRAPSA